MGVNLKTVNLTYSVNDRVIIDNINLDIKTNGVYCIIGDDFSGKSTLLKLLGKINNQTAGEVIVCNAKSHLDYTKFISYLPDEAFLPSDMTIKEIIKLYNTFFEDFDYSDAVGMIADLLIPLNKKICELSSSEKRLVELTVILSRKAKVYLLDEPLSAINECSLLLVTNAIKRCSEKSVVVMTVNNSDAAKTIADCIITLQCGTLISIVKNNPCDVNFFAKKHRRSI